MTFAGVVTAGPTVAHHTVVAVEAERLGYESAWVTEVSGPDAVTVLAAAATATSRITLATGIVSTFVRDPYLMAMTLASLQDLSGGRVIAGLGTSTSAIVTGWHGLQFAKPLGATREYVKLMRQLLAGERVKSEGIYEISGASLRSAAQTPVPIYLGALNPRMLELAGEIADGVILNFPTPTSTAESVAAVERGIARAGRRRGDVTIVANMRTGLTAGFDDVAAPLRRDLVSYTLTPVYQRLFSADGYAAEVEAVTRLWAAGDRDAAVAAISDRMVDAHALVGSIETCREKALALLARGVDQAVLFPVVADGPGGSERALQMIRAFAPKT
jgi:probable F420-dependent oxidoreductase